MTSGNTGSAFELDELTGILRVANTLDRETTAKYTLQIKAMDQGSTPLTATVTATVTIQDINDNEPIFSGPFYLDVAENVPNSTFVGTVIATDADTGSNAIIYYTLVATSVGTQDHFRIEAGTGDVYTNSEDIDRESIDSYVLVVRASNDGSPTLYSDTEVSITITDVNDIVPLLSQHSYSTSVVENSAVSITLDHVMLILTKKSDMGSSLLA